MKLDRLWLLVMWLLLAFAASLLRYKTLLSGDSLFVEHLATDLFVHGGQWRDWKFPVAPAFVPDMLLYLAAFGLLPDAMSRIFAVSACQVFLLAGTALWFARHLYPQLGKRAMAVIVLGTAFVTLTAARSSMWLYFYSTNNHFPAVLFGLAGLVLAQRQLERPSTRLGAALVLTVVAGSASTGLYDLTVALPALVALGIAWYLCRGNGMADRRRSLARVAIHVVAGLVLAKLLLKALIHHKSNDTLDLITPDMAGRSMMLFVQATMAAFNQQNHYTSALSLLLLAALLYVAVHFLRSLKASPEGIAFSFGNPRIAAAGTLLAFSLPLTVAGTLVAGRFGDEYAYRYFTFPLVLAVLLAIVLLDRRMPARAWDAILLCGGLVTLSGGIHMQRKGAPVPVAALIANCLLEVEKQHGQLHAGISDYWTGPSARQYMPSRPPILTTMNDLTTFFWMTTIGPVLRPERYPGMQYHFALLRPRNDTSGFNYTADTIGKVLPPPSRIHMCGTGNEVWLYEGMELDNAVRKAGADFLRAQSIER